MYTVVYFQTRISAKMFAFLGLGEPKTIKLQVAVDAGKIFRVTEVVGAPRFSVLKMLLCTLEVLSDGAP